MFRIVPLARIPPHVPALTYAVPAALSGVVTVGSLVRIPLREKSVIGLVIEKDTGEEPARNIKEIESVVAQLPAWYMHALQQAAAHIAVPLNVLLYALIPRPPKRWKHIALPGAQAHLPVRTAPHTVHVRSTVQDVHTETVQVLQELSKSGKRVLVLCGRQNDQNAITEAALKAKIPVQSYGESSKPSARWQIFTQALANEPLIIISSRLGCLLPAQWGHIIMVNDHADSHKQFDATPRYDARSIAKQSGTPLTVITTSPNLAFNHGATIKNPQAFLTASMMVMTDRVPKDHLLPTHIIEKIEDATDEKQSALLISANKFKLPTKIEQHVSLWSEQELKYALETGTAPKQNLIIVAWPEQLLNLHEPESEERLFYRLRELKNLLQPKQRLIFVTQKPERYLLALNPQHEQKFLDQLLEERAALLYPPYGSIAKCIIKGKTVAEAMQKAESWKRKLQEAVTDLQVLGPQTTFPAIQHGTARALIICKGTHEQITRIKPLLTQAHGALYADIDPISIFR